MIVPLEIARQEALSYKRALKDNMFPNPAFANSLLPLLGGESSNADAYIPDGWTIDSERNQEYVFDVADNGGGKSMNVINQSNGTLSFGTKIYGLPACKYELTFRAKGDATVRLFLKKNGDYISQYYGGATRFTAYETIKTKMDYQDYKISFEIPEPHVNPYNKDGDVSHLFSHGYEDNISNVRLSVSLGSGKDFSICGLELKQVDDSSMGIGVCNIGNTADDAIYNLQGQQISKPVKGLYIIKGRKVLVK